jgi:hypothetical protein
METFNRQCIFAGNRPGLVELKVGKNMFSEAQLHLELVFVSLSSVFKQGVALLVTDCLQCWGAWSFESKNIIRVWYLDSREAIADFKVKMETVQQRCDALHLPTIAEEVTPIQRVDKVEPKN